ncbi:unnamed protein product, partial [Prorocentrum cordatum]
AGRTGQRCPSAGDMAAGSPKEELKGAAGRKFDDSARTASCCRQAFVTTSPALDDSLAYGDATVKNGNTAWDTK